MANEDDKNAPDLDLKGFKSEIDTKFSSVADQLKALQSGWQESMQTVTDAIISTRTPKPDPVQDVYVDPDEAARLEKVRKSAVEEATRSTQAMFAKERERDRVLASYAAQYPEMQTPSSAFNKAILDAHKTIPKSIQETAEGYEMAILRAASQLGVVPKDKRQTTSDDFTFGGGPSGETRSKAKSKDLDEGTITLAQLINQAAGRQVDDKVLEGIKQASKREKWNKYE
jgi:hypothetical protein